MLRILLIKLIEAIGAARDALKDNVPCLLISRRVVYDKGQFVTKEQVCQGISGEGPMCDVCSAHRHLLEAKIDLERTL